MNVFDEEMGPLTEAAEVERLRMLFAAGLSLSELRAFESLRNGWAS